MKYQRLNETRLKSVAGILSCPCLITIDMRGSFLNPASMLSYACFYIKKNDSFFDYGPYLLLPLPPRLIRKIDRLLHYRHSDKSEDSFRQTNVHDNLI